MHLTGRATCQLAGPHLHSDLYGDLSKISEKGARRRLGLTGHSQIHVELPAYHFVLWEPTHSKCCPGRLLLAFVDTLKRDIGVANTAELVVKIVLVLVVVVVVIVVVVVVAVVSSK